MKIHDEKFRLILIRRESYHVIGGLTNYWIDHKKTKLNLKCALLRRLLNFCGFKSSNWAQWNSFINLSFHSVNRKEWLQPYWDEGWRLVEVHFKLSPAQRGNHVGGFETFLHLRNKKKAPYRKFSMRNADFNPANNIFWTLNVPPALLEI